MVKFICNKVPRDKVIELMADWGVTPNLVKLDDNKFAGELKNKLLEEALEVKEAFERQELVEELADVLEVVEALAKKNNISQDEILIAKKNKLARNGGYENNYFMESIEIDENNPKIAYFRAKPNKWIEFK